LIEKANLCNIAKRKSFAFYLIVNSRLKYRLIVID